MSTRRTRQNQNVRIVEESDESDSDNNSTPAVFRRPGTPPSVRSQSSQKKTRSQNRKGSQSQHRRQSSSDDDDDEDLGEMFEKPIRLNHGEMLSNLICYFTSIQGKMNPVRKSDIIKNALNKQSREFRDLIHSAKTQLLETFGLVLVGMKNGPGDTTIECGIFEASSFMVISKFRQHTVTLVQGNQRLFNQDLNKAILLLILSCSYMLDKNLDEDVIWQLLEKMNFSGLVCKKREDLRRFLKTEYVDSLYLSKVEPKDTDQTVTRYGWGLRANKEISKYAILKFVAEKMGGKRPQEFPVHLSRIDREEIERIDEENERWNQEDFLDEENESGTQNDIFDKEVVEWRPGSGSNNSDGDVESMSPDETPGPSKSQESQPRKRVYTKSDSDSESEED